MASTRRLDLIRRRVVAGITPDLIQPKYRRADCTVAGACYIVSEALYHLGAREAGFEPKHARTLLGTHWWLENRTTGERLDATAEQFDAQELSGLYPRGVFGGFLTKQPSARAATLIHRATARPLGGTRRDTT